MDEARLTLIQRLRPVTESVDQRLGPRGRWVAAALIVILLGLAIFASLRATTLSTAQVHAVSVRVAEVPVDDPSSPIWDRAPQLEVTMIPQTTVVPMMADVTVPVVKMRTLNDGHRIGFLLEWEDAEANWSASGFDDFSDAAALQFGLGENRPPIGMGTIRQPVNIWHWRANWQWDIEEGFRDVTDLHPNFFKDGYPGVGLGAEAWPDAPFRYPEDFDNAEARLYSPGRVVGNPLSDPNRTTAAEDALSAGFGSLTTLAEQGVTGVGRWEDGRWRLVLSRPLDPTIDYTVDFGAGHHLHVAFAVWDGEAQHRGARKQMSNFYTIAIR